MLQISTYIIRLKMHGSYKLKKLLRYYDIDLGYQNVSKLSMCIFTTVLS